MTRNGARDLDQNPENEESDPDHGREKRTRRCRKLKKRPLRRMELRRRIKTEHRRRRRNPLLRMKLWLRRGRPDLEVAAEKGLDLERKKNGRDPGLEKSADPGKVFFFFVLFCFVEKRRSR